MLSWGGTGPRPSTGASAWQTGPTSRQPARCPPPPPHCRRMVATARCCCCPTPAACSWRRCGWTTRGGGARGWARCAVPACWVVWLSWRAGCAGRWGGRCPAAALPAPPAQALHPLPRPAAALPAPPAPTPPAAPAASPLRQQRPARGHALEPAARHAAHHGAPVRRRRPAAGGGHLDRHPRRGVSGALRRRARAAARALGPVGPAFGGRGHSVAVALQLALSTARRAALQFEI